MMDGRLRRFGPSPGTALAAVLLLVYAVAATPSPPVSQPASVPSTPSAPAMVRPTQEPGRRNLFLAPARVRAQQSPGKPSAAPPLPSVPLPPPPLPLPASPVPLPPLSLNPLNPLAPPQPPPAQVVRPDVLGVLSGPRPQAILAHGADVVTAGVGDPTPWGTIVKISDGAVVLRTAAGPMTLRIALQGVR